MVDVDEQHQFFNLMHIAFERTLICLFCSAFSFFGTAHGVLENHMWCFFDRHMVFLSNTQYEK